MPEFILDTGGTVLGLPAPNATGGVQADGCYTWDSLDSFTQGYVKALFFTESGSETDGKEIGDAGFSALAPETLARIIADCAKFQEGAAWLRAVNAAKFYDFPGETAAGRDFWFTRNGHGCGFWDGDWPEPHATALTDAAKSFGEVDAYLGDDGRVYL